MMIILFTCEKYYYIDGFPTNKKYSHLVKEAHDKEAKIYGHITMTEKKVLLL